MIPRRRPTRGRGSTHCSTANSAVLRRLTWGADRSQPPWGGGDMTGWTTEAVLAAAAAWTWVPPGSANVRTGDYLLTAFPAHLRASFPVEVQWSDSDRPAGE